MAYSAALQLDGTTYELRSAKIFLERGSDDKGRPLIQSNWVISVILDALQDTIITEWMVDPQKKMDGKVFIRCTDATKEIEFKEAYCLKMLDEFNPGIDFASCECHIKGKEISINSTPYIPNWID
jgi:hypothetical protein